MQQDLTQLELEFARLVAAASAATDTARAAAAERDVRCAELRVRWAGRGAARRAGQAVAAAAAAADGVAPAVRAAFGLHLWWRLQPYVMEAATLCDGGWNPM